MNPLIFVIIAIVLVLLVVLALQLRQQRSDTIEERLGRYTQTENFLAIQEEQKAKEKSKEKQPSALTEFMDNALSGARFAQSWKTSLARADLKLTVGEFFALHIIAMSGLALFTFLVLSPGQIVQTIIAGGIGLFLPRIYVASKQGSRLRQFENQLPDILSLWVNSLRSGYSVLQALEAISRESPEPAASELRRVVQEQQLGITLEQALDHLLNRMPSEDLDLIITAVNIQREVGGNLAEILEVIGHTIRERIKLKGEIRVLTAQGRITGLLIGGLPIVLALFLLMINPNYMNNLFQNRFCGWPLLGIGLGLIGTGTAVIQKIVDIDI
jgi:tight adherence protein B